MSDQSSEPLLLLKRKTASTLDETIERCISEFGWAQLLQAVLVSLSWVFDAQQAFISVFTDTPAVNEWSLQDASSILIGLPASSFFIGCLIGGLALSTLADTKLGRKNMLVISCVVMSITGAITSISTNIWIYSFLRFLTGFGRATIGTCALVLSTELVGSQWRGQVGIIGFVCFTIGFLSLPLIAFVNRGSSWRVLYLWTCIPTMLYSILVHFFVRESPRWLYVRGNKEEFVLTLKSITTRSSLTLSFFGSFIEFEDQEHNNSEESTTSLYSTIKMLVEKKWAFRRLISVMLVGFGIGTVYYVSMVRQALVLGGAFSPMLVAFGRTNRWLSYGVFGICIASCGLFVLCLPETKGRTLSDTMDEEEYKEGVFVC
ncbi:organic cation/carnitine transporter 3-like isoform X2 [Lycium barbarum]|uniref:organic cation/carnitine transporter 3-like isoform X2 n=1 Tax=Lycium barbarum TaxID=112863 RepID=UPI00293EB873|nr:organic cation/carnitine transporter 3-like isoform X2 [Lycium barbarum]